MTRAAAVGFQTPLTPDTLGASGNSRATNFVKTGNPGNPAATIVDREVAPNHSLFTALSESQVYRDFEQAFTRGTGLPLHLQTPETGQSISYPRKHEKPFCGLLAKTCLSCASCHAVRCRVEAEAKIEPKTLTCFAGLCETAVPVFVADKLIAFFHTGQVLLHRPARSEFNQIAHTLIEWGGQGDLKRVEEAWFNTQVLTEEQYESLVRLLVIFARHLSSCANALMLTHGQPEPPAVAKARHFIREHADEELSLGAVAHVVNMSPTYFSEKFKRATGINFVDYVSRTRIEKARHRLTNPQLRISEIAFDVGFQSLSQFNRAFRKTTGESPSEYRQSRVVDVAAAGSLESRASAGGQHPKKCAAFPDRCVASSRSHL